MVLAYLEKPVRFDMIHRWLKIPGVTILDVGCGNHSASLTKKYYPECLYFGLDNNREYDNDENDFKVMEKFYEVDLDKELDDLNNIPNESFDCMILSHVLEHLVNGYRAIPILARKIKPGGVIYIEFPSMKSKDFIRIGEKSKYVIIKGTFNFFDDSSHIETFTISEIKKILIKNKFDILKSGTRRSYKRLLFLPIYITGSIIRFGHIRASVFWDIFGFSEYIVAQKSFYGVL